jgi:hypothetical protein
VHKEFGLALLVALGVSAPVWGQAPRKPTPSFEDVLRSLSSAPADACEGQDFSKLEYLLFIQADDAVTQGLNQGPAGTAPDRARQTLGKLGQRSAEINKSWPEESRFQFEVLEVYPGLAVKMTYRNRATFSFFAVPENVGFNKPNSRWQLVSAMDDHRVSPWGSRDGLELFTLAGGPGKRGRFLASFSTSGCGSGSEIAYYAYEWHPEGLGELKELVKVEGSDSQGDPVEDLTPAERNLPDSFPPVGTLRTEGSLITLPYCWYSAIDTYHNPSLCEVDTYDLSGDQARFVSTVYNRPDLVPIARAVQYAQSHDYQAVRAYCASDDAAKMLTSNVPPFVFGTELHVTRVSEAHEIVKVGEDDGHRFEFEVEKTGDRWVVVSFQME